MMQREPGSVSWVGAKATNPGLIGGTVNSCGSCVAPGLLLTLLDGLTCTGLGAGKLVDSESPLP